MFFSAENVLMTDHPKFCGAQWIFAGRTDAADPGPADAAEDCVNVRIQPPGALTGSTQISSVGDTFMFNSVGIDATTNPGTYTLTYSTGCCASSTAIQAAMQQIEVN
jgi:hypothetical protein